VSDTRVKLHRVTTVRILGTDFLFSNSFRPVFFGVFAEEHGRVLLRGQFTFFFLAKIFVVYGLLFMVAWISLASYGAARAFFGGGDRMFLIMPLAGLAFCGTGFGLVRGSWWLSRGDIPYLTTLIGQALRNQKS
jgi:hypothetical protein